MNIFDRLLKLDKNLRIMSMKNKEEEEEWWSEVRRVTEPRRKTSALNIRDRLMPHRSVASDTIPRKLLIELASLSPQKFKIEAKSKCQTVVLPINVTTRTATGLENRTPVPKAKVATNGNGAAATAAAAASASPLENYYVTLKCTIVDKSLALVPPIRIFIPYNYPESNPLVHCIQLDEFDDDMLPEYSQF